MQKKEDGRGADRIHLVLILLAVWIIQLIIAFMQGIREGLQEDKDKKRQEEAEKLIESTRTEESLENMVNDTEPPTDEHVSLLGRMALLFSYVEGRITMYNKKILKWSQS